MITVFGQRTMAVNKKTKSERNWLTMKKYSKLLTGVMALAMVACMSVTAFAAESPEAGDTTINDLSSEKTQEITATAQATVTDPDDSYSVKITWENMAFTYTKAQPTGWQADSHTYSSDTIGAWNKTSAKITIVNDSNADVNASSKYGAGSEEMYGAVVTCEDLEETTLGAGTEDNVGGQTGDNMVEINVNVSGDPTQTFGPVAAGTVTVTIAAAD